MINSVSRRGAEVKQTPKKLSEEEKELIKNTGKSSLLGTTALIALELLDEADMIYDAPKCMERIIENSEKYLINVSKKYSDNAKKLGEIFGQVSKYTEARLKTVREFAQNGRFNYKRIGKAAAVGFAIAGGGYLIYRGIKSLINKKHTKTEA